MASSPRQILTIYGAHDDSNASNEDSEDLVGSDTTIHGWWRLACTVCAAASIVTSKLILVDFNFHYPLHLVTIQLIASGATAIMLQATRVENNNPTSSTEGSRPRLMTALRNCLDALSLALSTQSILHFSNLSTLAMLPVLAAFFDLVASSTIYGVRNTRHEATRTSILAVCLAFIFHGEYRLTANGIIFSTLTALCAGISTTVGRICQDPAPRSTATNHGTLFYATSLLLIITWAFFKESTWRVVTNFRLAIAPILVFNVFCSAAVILHGRSWVLPSIPHRSHGAPIPRHYYGLSDIGSYLTLAGVTGLSSVSMLRRSYTSPIQLVAFFAALVCLDNGQLFGLIYGYQGRAPRPIALTRIMRGTTATNDTRGLKTVVRRHFPISPLHIINTILLMGFWTTFLIKNFAENSRAASDLPVSLDYAYTPHTDVEIVISMYHEPLDSISSFIASIKAIPAFSSATVHIYTKAESADVGSIGRRTGADEVTQLPNVGREGETYLHHIVNNWDTLARHTLFVQGHVHNSREFFPRLRDYFDPEATGMLTLGFSGNVCDCANCGDRWGWSDNTIHSIFAKVYPGETCKNILLSYKGQFVASARRIRGVKREVYEELLDALVTEGSWAHQPEYLMGKEDSLNAPAFGFTLERMWNVLLQCSDLNVAWKCPTLLSGSRSGGGKGDCQCFDR